MSSSESTNTSNPGNDDTNYAVWEWNGEDWDCVDDQCDYGCGAVKPEGPGEYVGHQVTTACEPID